MAERLLPAVVVRLPVIGEMLALAPDGNDLLRLEQGVGAVGRERAARR